MAVDAQADIDRGNRRFWDELCGTLFARSLGITDMSAESLARFDRAYLALYPYLTRYLPAAALAGKRVLEIGPGYGTLGEILAERAARYVCVDIAAGPVAMMRHRLRGRGGRPEAITLQASALDLPFPDAAFDLVCTIGCLHHTGNVSRAVSEVHRVLGPGGRAVVMLYNRHSFRRLVWEPLRRLKHLIADRQGLRAAWTSGRLVYDTNTKGELAPHTEFVSRRDVRRLFGRFARTRVETRNFDSYALFGGRLVVARERLLDNLGRLVGLDLYIEATK